MTQHLPWAAWMLATAIVFGVLCYATSVVAAWRKFGRVKPALSDEADPQLDRFIPTYEVVERHHTRVSAPAEVTFPAAIELDLNQSAVIRAIFKGREWILRASPDGLEHPKTLLAQLKASGWRVLSEVPGREIVMGTVTQPWMADVVFRPVPPEEFLAFRNPGYVKIAWTLRVDSAGAAESVARTETRASSTDPAARTRFRRYWAVFSPGIILIRRIALSLVKKEAERRARL